MASHFPTHGAPGEIEGDERPSALTPSWSAKRILIVQPSDGVRTIVGRALRRYGYVVIDSANADDAVAHARRGTRIDVVLVEIENRELSGPELMVRLRRFAPTVRTVFIGARRHPRRNASGEATLDLPFGTSELLAALRSVTGGFTS